MSPRAVMRSDARERGEEGRWRRKGIRLQCSSEHLGQPSGGLQRRLPIGGVPRWAEMASPGPSRCSVTAGAVQTVSVCSSIAVLLNHSGA